MNPFETTAKTQRPNHNREVAHQIALVELERMRLFLELEIRRQERTITLWAASAILGILLGLVYLVTT